MAEIASNFYTCPHFSPARFARTHLSPSSSRATTPNIYSPLTHIMLDMQLRACRTRSQDHTSTGATSKTRCTTLSHTDVGMWHKQASHAQPQATGRHPLHIRCIPKVLRACGAPTFTLLRFYNLFCIRCTFTLLQAKPQTFTIYATPIAIVAYLHTSSCCWRGPTPKGESYA